MNDIVAADQYDAIRELLGVDAVELPSATIELPPYLPTAELRVRRAVVDWSARLGTPDDALQLQLAVMSLTAVALIPRLKNRLRSGERIGEWSAGSIDWDTLSVQLQEQADAALGALLTPTDDAEPVEVFTVAGVSRARHQHHGVRSWP